MLSINFISEFDNSAASFRSRILRLYKYVSSIMTHVELNGVNNSYDIVVIQKASTRFIYKQFLKYKKRHTFIIFDIDDYCDNKYKFFIKHADLVVVGSSFLKEKWQYLNENIVVLDDPVDINDLNIPLKKQLSLKRCKLGWFGNITNLDILHSTNVSDVKTITRGGDIEWSPDTIDKNIQKFDLILLPQDIHSNYGAAKGNCRMLKSLYLGVPVLCSDLAAYVDLAELLDYPREMIMHDGEDWNKRIQDIKDGVIAPKFDFKKYRELILANYSFETRGQQWLDIVTKYYNHRHCHFIKNVLFWLHGFPFLKIRNGNNRTIIILGFIKINYKKRTKNG